MTLVAAAGTWDKVRAEYDDITLGKVRSKVIREIGVDKGRHLLPAKWRIQEVAKPRKFSLQFKCEKISAMLKKRKVEEQEAM